MLIRVLDGFSGDSGWPDESFASWTVKPVG